MKLGSLFIHFPRMQTLQTENRSFNKALRRASDKIVIRSYQVSKYAYLRTFRLNVNYESHLSTSRISPRFSAFITRKRISTEAHCVGEDLFTCCTLDFTNLLFCVD